ncbi:Uncharacterised protein [uncultured archaeon]|nr:Uncharacterised protein [uncultured archaeon]
MNEQSVRNIIKLMGLCDLRIDKAKREKDRVEEIVEADIADLFSERDVTERIKNEYRTSLIKARTYYLNSAIAELENQREDYRFCLGLK